MWVLSGCVYKYKLGSSGIYRSAWRKAVRAFGSMMTQGPTASVTLSKIERSMSDLALLLFGNWSSSQCHEPFSQCMIGRNLFHSRSRIVEEHCPVALHDFDTHTTVTRSINSPRHEIS